MKILETKLKGCYVLEPTLFDDERGRFFESYNHREFQEKTGLRVNFVQDNHSISKKGVLRGLHFQAGEYAQAKLVRVIKGAVLDVVVDLRKGSSTFGEYFKTRLSEDNHKMLFIPEGMAHGFLALEEDTVFTYKCSRYYHKSAESGIIYNDADLDIDWEYPSHEIILSEKDRQLLSFKDLGL